ncbi:hypothetical protein AB0P21_04865 [Kribbella sp. NPDC056861]|uniref:hypothetical protein n=1 Tax=Kribbella sp. NPDC056861 TaxID=3154857 RepID=UPI00341CD00B
MSTAQRTVLLAGVHVAPGRGQLPRRIPGVMTTAHQMLLVTEQIPRGQRPWETHGAMTSTQQAMPLPV